MNLDRTYVEKIAEEYAPKERDDLKKLEKLDRKAKLLPKVFAYVFGTVCTLIFGTGMTLGMKVLGADIEVLFYVGIGLGLIGIAGISINYLIYKKLLNYNKKKYGNDIIELAKKILEE